MINGDASIEEFAALTDTSIVTEPVAMISLPASSDATVITECSPFSRSMVTANVHWPASSATVVYSLSPSMITVIRALTSAVPDKDG